MEKAIKRYFPIFVLPTIIAFTIGFIAPFLLGVYLSFCKFTTVTDAKFIGLANYVKIFEESDFTHSLVFTVLFTIVTVVLINVLAFAVAMLLTKGFRGTNVFRTVFFMPNLIGGIILGYIWQLLLNGILSIFDRTLTYSAIYGFWGLVILTHLYCRYPEYSGRADRGSQDGWCNLLAGAEKCHSANGYAVDHNLFFPDTDQWFQTV